MPWMRFARSCLSAAAALALGCADRAPTDPAAVQERSITAATMRARIGALADDSTRGRYTPSLEINKAADWAAAAFRDDGLAPGVAGEYLQLWPTDLAPAPNVAGILAGSSAALRGEYVLFVAHFDHIGTTAVNARCVAQGADSTCNGADDNASGAAAVLELAHAFAGLQPRPLRSIIFLLVSGEERGLWGSQYYAQHPGVRLDRTVAVINLDMISRNAPDSLQVLGGELTTLGTLLDGVEAAHPGLGLHHRDAPWDAGGSDHWPFVMGGVASLCFNTGTHPDYHRPSDSAGAADADKAARVARLAFQLGLAVANAASRPAWTSGVPIKPQRGAPAL